MSIINYHDPTVINWNLDNNGNLVSVPIENEVKQIVDGKIPLEGLPDQQYRIQIDGFVEIGIRDKIDSANKFKCDYTHGVLYFDNSLEGQEINIDKYYSRGQFYTPANRIWTKLDNFGKVIETLEDVVDNVDLMKDLILNYHEVIDSANELKDILNNTIQIGNNLDDTINDTIIDGQSLYDILDTLVEVADISKSELESTIASSNIAKGDLTDVINNANSTLDTLNGSINDAYHINNLLADPIEGNIKKATDIYNNLTVSISDAITAKNNLDESIQNSIAAKSDLDASIQLADITKQDLDASISQGQTAKSNLDGSIDMGNQTKQELDITITEASGVNDNLEGNISAASDAESELIDATNVANQSKSSLDESISNSNQAKANLDDSIASANSTKQGLDNSITEGNNLKGDLIDIVESTDYEQIIIDVGSLKDDQHNHNNKDILDELSDEAGSLQYKGQDVGIGDMTKAEYDVDGDGKVDIANDSDKLGGQLPSHYADKSYVDTELNTKVDKVEGKGLSTNDYTTVEKNKLAGIEEGANKYIHPSTHPASMITESTSRRFVSDAEKSMWNSKAEITDIPTKVGQLENDENYVTQEDLESATYGSMAKSVYDKDNDGIVDVAETVIGNEIQLGNYKLVYNETTNSLDIEVVA